MPTYEESLAELKFQGNVVIRFGGQYYAIREPDSGLSIPRAQQRLVRSLVVNPTTIDPKRVTTTIASYSFTLVDKDGIISRVVKDDGRDAIGQDLELWIGRTGVGMSFADYKVMPQTKISRCSRIDGGWSFASKESTDRLNRPIYETTVRLSGDIVALTTTIISKDAITDFPSSGYFVLDDEVISYASKNDGTKTFSGCARGEFGTIPAAHEDDTDLKIAETVTDNPLNIILKILTSGSGVGSYDTLVDGLAIDPSLVDVAGIESLRDEIFDGDEFSFALFDIDRALTFIETELLQPCNLRFTYANNGKLTLALLDRSQFVEDLNVIDHDSLVGEPDLVVDDQKIVNRIEISFGYDWGTKKYAFRKSYRDEDSITDYGKSASDLSFSFKGTDDEAFVDDFAAAMLERLSTPKPEVQVASFISKSTLNVGGKARLETTKLPDSSGELNFAADMEVVKRSINFQTGEVRLTLVYTSNTDTRLGYFSPADYIDSVTSQSIIELPAGRGSYYRVGWKMRLRNIPGNAFETDPVNTITAIDGDEITFENAWTTVLSTDHKIVFAEYDQVAPSQKRYAFFSPNASDDFSVLEKSYKFVP